MTRIISELWIVEEILTRSTTIAYDAPLFGKHVFALETPCGYPLLRFSLQHLPEQTVSLV